MALQLQVRVAEARGLAAKDLNGLSDPYVRLSLGKSKAKSSTVYKNLNPKWDADFFFAVDDPLTDVLNITVWDEDYIKADDFLGQLSLPISDVYNAPKKMIPPAWYRLQKASARSVISGEISIGLYLSGGSTSSESLHLPSPYLLSLAESPLEGESDSSAAPMIDGTLSDDSSLGRISSKPGRNSPRLGAVLKNRITHALSGHKDSASLSKASMKRSNTRDEALAASFASNNSLVHSESLESSLDVDINVPLAFFDEDMNNVPSVGEMPPAYVGGVVLDQTYAVKVHELNAIFFRPDSEFWSDFASARKLTELEMGHWTEVGGEKTRTVTYMTAPSALVKSVRATETVRYARADAGGYLVEVSVATPDVPYGSTFLTELQFCFTPINETSSNLRVSWRANFLQSTMMKSMIENGMKSGIKETYAICGQVLSKYATPVGAKGGALPTKEEEVQTTLDIAKDYFYNVPTAVAVLALLLVPLHMRLAGKVRVPRRGLEFWGLDLPDSYLELFYTAAIVLALERLLDRLYSFVYFHLRMADPVKGASGNGWLTTVTLVEAENLPAADITGFSDPYVTVTCNGRTRTSSVKIQTLSPRWNEILEFDAFEDPPLTMALEVLDYDGPFFNPESLGVAGINLLKHSSQDLMDLWVPLEGKEAIQQGARIHLRVSLVQSENAMPKIYENLEKKVGSKVRPKSAEENHQFQRLFSLPDSEFLLSDFACAVKKKIPYQGRLFLSPRQLAFYSNLFGSKVRFTLMWEDVEEIRSSAPAKPTAASLHRLINPTITIYVKAGKGTDSKSGSYGVDDKGRLKFRFMSFVRPSVASRTVQALWKNQALPEEQKLLKVEEANASMDLVLEPSADVAAVQKEDEEGAFESEPTQLEEVANIEVPVTVEQFFLMLEQQHMASMLAHAAGQLNWTASPWQECEDRPFCSQREVKYQLTHQMSSFGTAVTVIQQRSKPPGAEHAKLEELITMHDVPFGDHFQVETIKELWLKSSSPPLSNLSAKVGLTWLKASAMKEKISQNVVEYYKQQTRDMVEELVRQLIAASQGSRDI